MPQPIIKIPIKLTTHPSEQIFLYTKEKADAICDLLNQENSDYAFYSTLSDKHPKELGFTIYLHCCDDEPDEKRRYLKEI